MGGLRWGDLPQGSQSEVEREEHQKGRGQGRGLSLKSTVCPTLGGFSSTPPSSDSCSLFALNALPFDPLELARWNINRQGQIDI